MPAPSPILEVERAISELRRAERVLLSRQGRLQRVASAEHHPALKAISDPAHPAVQLMKLAGLLPGAVLEEAKAQDTAELLTVSQEAIAQYPQALAESLVRVSDASVPLKSASDARIIAFRPRFGHEEHLAVVVGNPSKAPLVRLHSSCLTGDVFGSLRCDCGSQLHLAMQSMVQAGGGVVIYLSQEGRGIGIANKLRAYRLQDEGMDTVEANEALGFAPDERDFALAARMLKELGYTRVRLLTNNPGKIESLSARGIVVEERVPLVVAPTEYNERYLDAKALKLRHQF